MSHHFYGPRTRSSRPTITSAVSYTGTIIIILHIQYWLLYIHALTLFQGGWLLLQNGHLALDFLEELLNSIVETENVHESFRLWMTTEVHDKFPINLLQVSIKYTFAPPQGVKAGIKRTYSTITQVTYQYILYIYMYV